jgi:hypothetical protein
MIDLTGIGNIAFQGISAGMGIGGSLSAAEEEYYNYLTRASLTYREKQEALNAIELKRREAALMKTQAKEAEIEAGYVKKIGEIVLREQQYESEELMAEAFSKQAKSGVAMNFGSPLDYMGHLADRRAFAYGVTNFERDTETWKAQRQARNIKEKATIMIGEVDAAQKNIGMYDYQAELYKKAAKGSKKKGVVDALGYGLKGLGKSLGSF